MEFQSFTKNYEDLCSEAGFQFDSIATSAATDTSQSSSSRRPIRRPTCSTCSARPYQVGADLAGAYRIGNAMSQGASMMSQSHSGMTPEWHKEYEVAFEQAQNEAKGHFHRCPKCHRYVCDADWNEDDAMCVEDAPRENVEVTAARAQRMKDEIQEKAQTANVFHGDIERRTTVCPQCGKPAGEGKFCNNCGAPMGLAVCPKCGAKLAIGTRFCGECGTKMD